MKSIAPICGLVLFLSACAESPEAACEEYIEAAVGCLNQAYAGTGSDIEIQQAALDQACVGADSLSGSARKAYVDQMNCYTEAYAAGDCSTPETYQEIGNQILTCVGG